MGNSPRSIPAGSSILPLGGPLVFNGAWSNIAFLLVDNDDCKSWIAFLFLRSRYSSVARAAKTSTPNGTPIPAPYAALRLFDDGAGTLGVEVGLREGGRPVLERMLEVDIEEVNGVGVLSKELVLEIDERAVDDLTSAVITVIVE